MYKKDFFNRIDHALAHNETMKSFTDNNPVYQIKISEDITASNHLWDIPTNETITSHRKGMGRFIVIGKKIVRKFLFWLVSKPFIQQREFNGSITRSVNYLNEIIRRQQVRLDSLAYINQELRENQQRLEQTLNQYIKLVQKRESFPIDYHKFENQFRGSESAIVSYQLEAYTPYLQGQNSVLDLGCGRGEFLFALKAKGHTVSGVEINSDLVDYARNKGIRIIQGDIITYLEDKSDLECFDAVICSHVVEHLYPYQIISIVENSFKRLNAGGRLIIETPNPECLFNLAYGFSIDMSHKKIVHPYTLKFIYEQAGFKNIQIKHLAPLPDEVKLTDNTPESEKINRLLFGYQNYAIIGEKTE